MTEIDIAIPVFNEELHLEACLDSVLKLAIPRGYSTNIFIIDGGSTDKTVDIAKQFQLKNDNIIILHNEKKIQSCALNLAIEEGDAEYFLRLDAHSYYPTNYLSACLETAKKTNADNVGGYAITEPGSSTYGASLVQALTTHFFGVGNSSFRVGAEEGEVDTVPYGFFKKDIFKKVGLFNEKLQRAQDYEFNSRIIGQGGTIWFNPDIKFTYKNQASLLGFYKKQILLEAPYNAYMWWLSPETFNFRHSITGLFSLGFIVGLILSSVNHLISLIFCGVMLLYIFLSVYASFVQAIRYKNFFHIFTLPFSFFGFHFLHGLGVLFGLCRLLLKRAPVQKID